MLRKLVLEPFKQVHLTYTSFSYSKPYVCASLTGLTVLTLSDFTCQQLTRRNTNVPYDYRRTLGLASFGFFYYGFVGRKIYFIYEAMLGPGKPFVKAFIDCTAHTAIGIVPCFYLITGLFKGQSVLDIYKQLKSEYWTACFGTFLYWIPLMSINFRFMTPETRILFITTCSYIHKTGLSWYSNRVRMNKLIKQYSNDRTNEDIIKSIDNHNYLI